MVLDGPPRFRARHRNSSGSTIDHIDYDGFGNPTETQQANGDRYKWTGREFDIETGLQYNVTRFYDPKVGRWTARDPLGFVPGDANLYRYVGNATLRFTDPFGLWRGIKPWLKGIIGWMPSNAAVT